MAYEPEEGIDYIINYYALAGVAQDAKPDEIKRALNQRQMEYHPDRLEGLAPEFRAKGERMAKLINRASGLLLNEEIRTGYDEILKSWDGPISEDGTPIVQADRYLQMELSGKPSEEIESIFSEQAKQIEAATGYSPRRLSFIERMIDEAGDDVTDDMRAENEEALLAYDRALAIQEAERSRLLSRPDIRQSNYVAGIGYADTVAAELEAAKKTRLQEMERVAIARSGQALALMSIVEIVDDQGSPVPKDELSLTMRWSVPEYYDLQAAKVQEIAEKRQELVEKRLSNFVPDYPYPELQTEALPNLAIGMGSAEYTWFGVSIDTETCHASVEVVPPEILTLLNEGNYSRVIEHGYNVMTFAPLQQIEVTDQLLNAIEKHAEKYGIGNSD